GEVRADQGGEARRGDLQVQYVIMIYNKRPQEEFMKRRQFTQALGAAGALAALHPFGIVRAQAQKLKVGVILPRSGYLSFIGQSCQKGADLAPGVIKELLGVDIELMNAD